MSNNNNRNNVKRPDLRATYYNNIRITHVRKKDKHVVAMLISDDRENGCLYMATAPKMEPKLLHTSYERFHNTFNVIER